MVRTAIPPAALDAALRRELKAVDPYQPISTPTTMEHAVVSAIPRFDVELFVIFAAIGLMLSIVGVYGVAPGDASHE